jgi:hypothetical protein
VKRCLVRSIRHSAHCAGIAVLTGSVFGAVAFSGQLHRYRVPASACINVTTNDHLSGPAFRTIQHEASRIWLRHGVALTWTEQPAARCDTFEEIVFDDDQLIKLAKGKVDTALARTVFLGRSRTIYVSAPRAFEMLAQLRDKAAHNVNDGERDVRGGTLLGRIVAHELGHALLTTLAHSKSGLMRPVFGLKDVLSNDERLNDLTPVESNRLAMRFSLVPFDSPSAPSVLTRREMTR